MDTPRGLREPRRLALLIPLAALLLLVGAAIGFALAHFYIKGTLSPAELHARQEAAGGQPQGRGPYGVEDFSEPAEK